MSQSNSIPLITPGWPAPANITAFSTTRKGGFSLPPFDSLNLGQHVGDNTQHVRQNRSLLPNGKNAVWLQQVHGIHVVPAHHSLACEPADASYTDKAGVMCCVMTADCLPVLLCSEDGTWVAAIHAGWRGLAQGVIENTLANTGVDCRHIMAWMGPAIGAQKFEVGVDVYQAFYQYSEGLTATGNGKYLLDLYAIARHKLLACGVSQVYGGDYCTYTQSDLFFSHRRATHQGIKSTGRMATCIYLA